MSENQTRGSYCPKTRHPGGVCLFLRQTQPELPDAPEVIADIVLHAAVEPVDDASEAGAPVEAQNGVPVRLLYLLQHTIQIRGNDVPADLHQMPLEHVPADGIVDVVDGPLVVHHELDDGVGPLLH